MLPQLAFAETASPVRRSFGNIRGLLLCHPVNLSGPVHAICLGGFGYREIDLVFVRKAEVRVSRQPGSPPVRRPLETATPGFAGEWDAIPPTGHNFYRHAYGRAGVGGAQRTPAL